MKKTIYDTNGNPIGEEIKLNELTPKDQNLKEQILNILEPKLEQIYKDIEDLKNLIKK